MEKVEKIARFGGLRRRGLGSDERIVLSPVQAGLVRRVVGDESDGAARSRRLVLAAMSMGTGKTLAALATLCVMRARASPRRVRALFVVPKSTIDDAWRRQMRQFTRLSRDDVKIITYSRLQSSFSKGWERVDGGGKRKPVTWKRTVGHPLVECRRDLLVFDESHTLRNANTILARAARVASKRATKVLCLTGTPVHNGPKDASGQLMAMGSDSAFEDPKVFGSRVALRPEIVKDFAERYVYTATLQEAGVELPPKLASIEWVDHEMNLEETRRYNESLKSVRGKSREALEKTGKTEKTEKTHHMLILRQMCVEPALCHKHGRSVFDEEARRLTVLHPGPKLRTALDLVKRMTFEGHAKIVVVSEFVTLLDVFGDLLSQRLGENSVAFDGRLRGGERRSAVREFIHGDARVLRLSLGAGAYGLTLVPATAMIVMDVWFNPAVHRQVEARIHRVGQTKPVVIKTLVTRRSIEAAILESHDEKQACATAFQTKNSEEIIDPVLAETAGYSTARIAEKCPLLKSRK
jgi:SNF2 family DNA or RNA helicase